MRIWMRWILVAGATALVAVWAPRVHQRPSLATDAADAISTPRVIILGFDGLDPQLCRQMIADGELPHLAALGITGDFRDLETVMPPQSPVAWATVATGAGPDVHGIFDFVHRDPNTHAPISAMSRVVAPPATLPLGSTRLPLFSATSVAGRRGTPFWGVLAQHGIPCTILECPAEFPPTDFPGRSLSGMGTPDLLGSHGRFTYFYETPAGETSDGEPLDFDFLHGYPTPHPSGDLAKTPADPQETPVGRFVSVRFSGETFFGDLRGPDSPYSATGEAGRTAMTVWRDRAAKAVAIGLDEQRIVLREGEWSEWVPVRFSLPGLIGASVSGMVRMCLRTVEPLALYVSPINLDPIAPAQRISTPSGYSGELARAVGRFYTETIPEDYGALEAGALNRHEFRDLLAHINAERWAKLSFELGRHRSGVLFAYFGISDIAQHMYHREARERDLRDIEFFDTIRRVYRDLDALVGRVNAVVAADPAAVLIVISDHGFAPLYRLFDVNRWLEDHGYLVRRPEAANVAAPLTIGLRAVDWSQTKAYALGINAVYLNLEGREKHGIVPQADAPRLVAELREKLMAVRDATPAPWPHDAPEESFADEAPQAAIFREVYVTAELYPRAFSGETRDEAVMAVAPDLLLGYRRGYRTSWIAAEGGIGASAFISNVQRWSGDHCVDFREVPGVWFSNRRLPPTAAPTLADIAPTILSHYGVPIPPTMAGRAFPLLLPPPAANADAGTDAD